MGQMASQFELALDDYSIVLISLMKIQELYLVPGLWTGT